MPVDIGKVLRKTASRLLSYDQIESSCDAFVRVAPQPVQRWMEQISDFPIQRSLRSFPLLFIRIPKTGSTSLAHLVYSAHSIQHRTALFYKNADPQWFRQKVSFSVVRDPVRRAISACHFLLDEARDPQMPPLSKQTIKLLHGISQADDLVKKIILPASEEGKLHELDTVLQEQFPYISEQGKIIVNYVFKLEQQETIKEFITQYGFYSMIPHLNASRPRSVMSQDSLEILSHVYRRDIELLGYSRTQM